MVLLLVATLALQTPARAASAIGQVPAAALSAVEGDTADRLGRQWSRRLSRDPSDRAAGLGLAALAALQYDYAAADTLYRALLPGDEALPLDPIARHALLGLAEARAAHGLLRDATPAFRRAAAQALAAGDSVLAAHALIGLALVESRARRDDALDSLLQVALPLATVAGPAALGELRCARAGPPQVAGELDEKMEARVGAALAHSAGAARVEALCLLGIAKAHYRLGEVDSALQQSDRSIARYRAVHDQAGAAGALQWRGYVRLTRGDYAGAWHDLQDGLDAARASQSLGPMSLASLYLASLSLRFGDPTLALAHAEAAESSLTRAGNERILTTLGGIRADIARIIGDTAAARAGYLAMIARSDRFGGFPTVAPYRSLATMARQRHDWNEAGRQLAAARGAALAQGMGEWEKRLGYDVAALALETGDLAAAERGFLAFLAGLTPAEQARGYASRVRLAEVAARRGDIAGAEQWLTRAADSLDALRARLDVPSLRLQAFQIRDDEADPDLGFATVIAGMAEGGRAAQAFALVERRRGRELLDQSLRGSALRLTTTDRQPPAVVAPSLEELQSQLAARGLALASYVTGQGGEPTTLLLLSAGGLRTVRLAPIDSLAPMIARFTDLVENGESAAGPAARLGELLLGPVLRELPPGIGGLVVIPDRGLHRLPFSALVLDGPVPADWGVSLSPSAAFLARLWRRPATGGPTTLLAFGDPRRPGTAAAGWREAPPDAGDLGPLEEGRGEARSVARYAAEGAALIGDQATEAALKRRASGYRVLHFATHAVVSDQVLTRTALLLAPGDGEDGVLFPAEISALPLTADLVVLSACRSAAGVAVTGEGLRGLAAPFLEGGARAVVGSAWRVNDREVREFMRHFYDGLADGRAVGPALEAARSEARARGLPSSLWAGFVVVGDPTVIVPLRHPASRWPYGVALVGATVAGLVLLARRRRPT